MTEYARPLSIGGIPLSGRALLAPMAGITDLPFRALAERFGAGLVVSEMIASAALGTGHADMVRKLGRAPGRLPHVVQLAGCEPEWMARGAAIAADAGADIVDINFGCPSKRVTNGFAGSALMRVPDEALRIVEAIVGAAGRPVTAKMRLGWDDDSLNAPALARRAVDAGVRMITVHARTRAQFYKGEARWHLVRPVVEAVPDVPVVVNGDIRSLADARAALEQSGAAAVMIGSGAQGRPWVVGQVAAGLAGRPVPAAPDGAARHELIAAHYEAMLAEYGRDLGVRVARKHLGWYLDAAPVPSTHRKALLTCDDPAAVLAMLGQAFGGLRAAA